MMFVDAIDKFMHLVPGCPEPEAIDALRDAVIEFCDESQSWIYWVDDKTSNSLAFTVALNETKAIPIGLLDAYLADEQLDVIDINDQQAPTPTNSTLLTFDRTRLWDSIQLIPPPTVATPVRLLVTWKPTPWALEFPDHLWFSRAEALKAGALSRLMFNAGVPYSNPQAAVGYEQVFRSAIGAAAAAAGINRRTALQRLRVKPAE
jgi:hypothetical protein